MIDSVKKLQNFLELNSLEALKQCYGINYRQSTRNPRIITLNYDQIESRPGCPMAEVCRGLILRSYSDIDKNKPLGPTEVVARPMKRFYNLGDPNAAQIDFSHPQTYVYTKFDGTLIIMYFDSGDDSWHVGTRSVPDADVPMNGGSLTFKQLTELALGMSINEYAKMYNLQKGYTYCFELLSLENQIVVRYEKRQLVMLSIINNKTGKEEGVMIGNPLSIKSKEEIVEYLLRQNPAELEGFVVVDKDFNRVKIKHPGYIALNKVRDSAMKSPRAMTELILLEKDDDARPLLPEFVQESLETLKCGLVQFLKESDEQYEKLYSPDRKTFALAIKANNGWMSYCMQRFSGKCNSAKEYVLSLGKDGNWPNAMLDFLIDSSAKCKQKEALVKLTQLSQEYGGYDDKNVQ